MTDGHNPAFLAALRAMPERTKVASQIYDALVTTGRLHTLTPPTLTYRCQQRCSLIDVITMPDGQVIIGFPRYKTSPGATEETSNESGRAANTEDGYRRWRRHAAFSDNVSNPSLSCDHLRNVASRDEDIDADLQAGHAEVIVRLDGSRLPV